MLRQHEPESKHEKNSTRGGKKCVFPERVINITENSSHKEFEREVLAHPVFLLQPAI